MEAKDFMTKEVVTCTETETVADAAHKMVEGSFSCMPVVDDKGHLTGIVTQSDFVGKEVSIPHVLASVKQLFSQNFYFGDIEQIYQKAKELPLKSVMSKNLVTISPDTELSVILKLMISKKLKRLPVVENNEMVGIITRKDIVKAFDKLS